MDPEIIAYFDRRFEEAEQRNQERFEESERRSQERFAQVDQKFAQMDQRFAQVDQKFAQVDQQFEQVHHQFAQVDQQFEQVHHQFAQVDQQFARVHHQIAEVQEDVRHTNVLLEDLRTKIETVAEGVSVGEQRQDRDREKLRGEIREVRTFTEVSYRDLDRRVKVLEGA